MKFDQTIEKIISLAIAEDFGSGDITTRSVIKPGTKAQGHFLSKDVGIVCGLELMTRVFNVIDPNIRVTLLKADGDQISHGTVLAEIEGAADSILSGERVALNFLQHLSGIATKTSNVVKMVANTQLKILDTRKTHPGMRTLEKYAVKVGGGFNHRIDLAGGILIKNNHIKAAGGIMAAVNAARNNSPITLKIEVETETLAEVNEALEAGAEIIMLDNMAIDTMKEAVQLINGRALVEASGNMESKNLQEVALTGVDMVSIGGLTNNVKSLDISLRLTKL